MSKNDLFTAELDLENNKILIKPHEDHVSGDDELIATMNIDHNSPYKDQTFIILKKWRHHHKNSKTAKVVFAMNVTVKDETDEQLELMCELDDNTLEIIPIERLTQGILS